jgi:glycine cleavage system H protein
MRFTEDHEWIEPAGEVASIGITAFAANQLGDIVFVELPKLGTVITAGAAFAVVESVKAASDIFAPVSGEVIEVNTALSSEPDRINTDAEGLGWLIKVRVSDPKALDPLMDRSAYQAFLKGA